MSLASPASAPAALPDTLRRARRARHLSQLELALRLGASQRHISFVENGRARPSRELLLAWLRALDAPLPLRNAALLQAGYAPAYGAAALEHPELAQARAALGQLLAAHDPMPAFVIDAHWNLLQTNRGGEWLAATLAPALLAQAQQAGENAPPPNMLTLMLHPEGFARAMTNLEEVGPDLLARLRDEALAYPALTPHADALAALLCGRGRRGATPTRPPPVLSTRFASPHGPLAFFSMFTTFGTPQDITLASLRVEHLFPADEATRAVLTRALAVPEPPSGPVAG